jgi:hypothetical protein
MIVVAPLAWMQNRAVLTKQTVAMLSRTGDAGFISEFLLMLAFAISLHYGDRPQTTTLKRCCCCCCCWYLDSLSRLSLAVEFTYNLP